MTDEIKPKQDKSIKDTLANQLQESFSKDSQSKLKEQLKKTVDAIRIADNEKNALRTLIDDYEREKAAFNRTIKDLF